MSSSSWSNSGNWTSGVPTSSVDADFFDTTIVTSIDLGGNQSVLGLKFNGLFSYTISGNGDTLSIGSDGITLSQLGAGDTISSSVAFTSSNPTLSLASLTTLTLSGPSITGTSFTESGSGTLVITGSAVFSGTSTVSGGTLQIGSNGTSGSYSGNLSTSGTVAFERSDTYNYAGAISGTGSVKQAGAGTLVLTGTNTYSGGTTISSGTLQIGNGGATGALSGDISDLGTLVFNRGGSSVFSGVISGTGKLIQSGSGAVILTGANTYSGGTTISSGTLELGSGGTSGSIIGAVTDNGTLAFNHSYVGDPVTFSGAISGTGGLVQAGSGQVILTGNNTYSGGTTISSGTLQIGSGSTSGAISGAIANNAVLVFNRSDSVTCSSAISGTGGLVQTGSGTLILTASNSYSGGTTISAGTLQIGNGGSTGSISGNITNNGSLVFNSSTDFTLSGAITGSGAFFKTGYDKLTLTGTNTFTGTTRVSNGTLQIGNGGTTGSLAGDLVLASSGFVFFNRSDSWTFPGSLGGGGGGYVDLVGSGNVTFANLGSASSVYMIVEGSGTMTFSNGGMGTLQALAIGSSTGQTGTVVVDGAGTTLTASGYVGDGGNGGTLNVTNGATFKNTGDMPVGSTTSSANSSVNVSGSNSLFSSTKTVTFYVGSTTGAALNVSSNGEFSTVGIAGSGTVTLNGGTFGMTSTSSASNPFVLSSGGGTIDVSSGAAFTLSGTVGGSGALTKSGSGTLILTGTNSYTGSTSVSSGTLQIGTGGRLGSGGSYSGAISISSGAVLSYANSSSAQTLTGAISGLGTLAQDSTNDLILNTGTNSVANLSISGGRVFLNGAGSLGTIGTITLTGGILDFGNSALAAAPTTIMNFSSGSGIANRSLSSGLTLNTAYQSLPTSGTLSFNNDDQATSSITVSGNYPALTGPLEIQVGGSRVGANAVGSVTISGNISGSGNLTKSYTGTLILTGSNSFAGTTTISSGTLQLGAGTSTGSLAGDVVDNGTLVFNRAGTSYDFSGNISGTGNLIQNSSVTVRLGGSNTFTGGISVSAGTLTIGTSGSTGSITCDVNVGSTLIFNRTTDYAYSGNISGLGSIYKVNSNTLTLTGTNTYTGVTHLEGGLVNFSSLSTLGSGGTLTLNGGGLQWAAGSSTDISTRTVFLDTGGGNLNTNGNNVTLANAIGNGGAGALTKSGAGTLTLSGTAIYSGTTYVSAGKLVVSGSLSGTASASIFSGAALQVDGGINSLAGLQVSGTLSGIGRVGPVTMASGGTLWGGDSGAVGVFTLSGASSGSVALSGTTGATFEIELGKLSTGTPSAGTDYGQLKITQGTISLAKMTLSLAGTSTNVKNGDLFYIILNGSNGAVGTFNGLADQSVFTFGGQMYEISYFANHSTNTFATGGSSNDVALMAIPEPSEWALLMGGLCFLIVGNKMGGRCSRRNN